MVKIYKPYSVQSTDNQGNIKIYPCPSYESLVSRFKIEKEKPQMELVSAWQAYNSEEYTKEFTHCVEIWKNPKKAKDIKKDLR